MSDHPAAAEMVVPVQAVARQAVVAYEVEPFVAGQRRPATSFAVAGASSWLRPVAAAVAAGSSC